MKLDHLDLFDTSPELNYEGISKLTNLKSLFLGCNCLREEELNRLSTLTSLTIFTEEDVFTISDRAIQNLTQLVELDIRSSGQSFTDAALQNLISLQDISMSPSITDQGITHLTNLKILDLVQNSQITDHALEKLTQLQELFFDDYNLCCQHISMHYITKLRPLV